MPYSDAKKVFANRGVDVTGMNSRDLKSAWHTLLKKHHPDAGGTAGGTQEINAAYDTLSSDANYGSPSQSPADPSNDADPEKWMIYGFNGHFFNDGAKWTGGRDRFSAIIHAALAQFRGKDHVIALFVQNQTAPGVLEMVYMNGRSFVSGDIPQIPYEWAEFSHPSGSKVNELARALVMKVNADSNV